jgi:hypothetical protein
MKIKSITDESPDVYCITFTHETGDIEKSLIMGSASLDGMERYQLMKRITEAEKDIAYRLFGDDWRAHVSAGISETARGCFDQAVTLRPDLFGT